VRPLQTPPLPTELSSAKLTPSQAASLKRDLSILSARLTRIVNATRRGGSTWLVREVGQALIVAEEQPLPDWWHASGSQRLGVVRTQSPAAEVAISQRLGVVRTQSPAAEIAISPAAAVSPSVPSSPKGDPVTPPPLHFTPPPLHSQPSLALPPPATNMPKPTNASVRPPYGFVSHAEWAPDVPFICHASVSSTPSRAPGLPSWWSDASMGIATVRPATVSATHTDETAPLVASQVLGALEGTAGGIPAWWARESARSATPQSQRVRVLTV
jgi:hypothetical protein